MSFSDNIENVLAKRLRGVPVLPKSHGPHSVTVIPFIDPALLENLHKVESCGQATVYRAQFKSLPVAVKVYDLAASETEQRKRYFTELAALKSICHKNVVLFRGFSEIQRLNGFKPAIVSEWLDGGTLHDALKRGIEIGKDRLLSFCSDITSGLEYLHSRHMIHTDLCCRNILLSRPWNTQSLCLANENVTLKLIDMGLSKLFADSSKEPVAHGKPAYMAPELILPCTNGSREKANYKIDIFALGVVFINIATGEVDLFGASLEWQQIWFHRREQLQLSTGGNGNGYITLPASLYPFIADLIKTCLSIQPDLRPSAEGIKCYLKTTMRHELQQIGEKEFQLARKKWKSEIQRICKVASGGNIVGPAGPGSSGSGSDHGPGAPGAPGGRRRSGSTRPGPSGTNDGSAAASSASITGNTGDADHKRHKRQNECNGACGPAIQAAGVVGTTDQDNAPRRDDGSGGPDRPVTRLIIQQQTKQRLYGFSAQATAGPENPTGAGLFTPRGPGKQGTAGTIRYESSKEPSVGPSRPAGSAGLSDYLENRKRRISPRRSFSSKRDGEKQCLGQTQTNEDGSISGSAERRLSSEDSPTLPSASANAAKTGTVTRKRTLIKIKAANRKDVAAKAHQLGGQKYQPRPILKADPKQLEALDKGLKPPSRHTTICRICLKQLSTPGILKAHMRTHSDMRPFVCPTCLNVAFKWKKNLDAHLRRHGVKPHKCATCQEAFFMKDERQRHENRLHSEARSYGCALCPARFTTTRYLRVHLRIHARAKEHKCAKCEKAFLSTSALRCHEREVHSEALSYGCALCPARFTTISYLRVHLRVHAGAKPHKCAKCEKAFLSTPALRCHEREVHSEARPFECQTCPAKFKRKITLIRHTRIHTGEKPYRCHWCPATFRLGHHRKCHERQHAGAPPPPRSEA